MITDALIAAIIAVDFLAAVAHVVNRILARRRPSTVGRRTLERIGE